MFEIGWSELLVIGVVALIAIGPKELPGVLRSAGQWIGKIRRMAAEFQGQFQEALREVEMADLKKQVDEATSGLDTKFDPLDMSASTWKPNADAPAAAAASPATATPPSGTPEPPAPPPPPLAEPTLPLPEPAAAVTETDISPPPTGEGSRPA
jgi:sec-independent protein translocase protein TatB